VFRAGLGSPPSPSWSPARSRPIWRLYWRWPLPRYSRAMSLPMRYALALVTATWGREPALAAPTWRRTAAASSSSRRRRSRSQSFPQPWPRRCTAPSPGPAYAPSHRGASTLAAARTVGPSCPNATRTTIAATSSVSMNFVFLTDRRGRLDLAARHGSYCDRLGFGPGAWRDPMWWISIWVLVAALMASCTEQNVPVAPRDEPGLAFDAASLTSVVTDPLGDASLNTKSNVGPGADAKVPNYLDVVRAEVTKRGKIFVLTMDVGGVVPSNPGSLGGTQVWIWGLDTDPTTFPQGEPFSGGQSAPWEFFVDVEWDGAQFKGLL